MVHIEYKKQAIVLRQRGSSYSEILKRVPVAKSTLSLWLQEVGIAEKHKQRTTLRRLAAARRGAETMRRKKQELIKEIENIEIPKVGKLTDREKWLIGTALYWAEGSKEKIARPGSSVRFVNSDLAMASFFLEWLHSLKVNDANIKFDIYLHETSAHRLDEVKKYWAQGLGVKPHVFSVYFKRSKIKTNRQNTGSGYYGIVSIKPYKSSVLLRRIMAWIKGIHWGVV